MQELVRRSTAKRMHAVGAVPIGLFDARETLRLIAQQDHLPRDLLRESEQSRCSYSGALPLTPTRGGHMFEPSFAHREHAPGSSFGTSWTILSQGNRYVDDDH